MRLKTLYMILAAFLIGIASALFVLPEDSSDTINGSVAYTQRILSNAPSVDALLGSAKERDSPYDWIKEKNIHVYKDRVVIEIENPEWATFTDTNSMDPVIDYGSNAIEIVPSSPSYIHVGDIISYESVFTKGTVIHRVIKTGFDEDGWFAVMKGDNNAVEDPGKVRFGQVRRVVVAVIY